MKSHASALNDLRERLGVLPLKHLMQQPALTGLYRLTRYHADGAARHSIATLFCPTHGRVQRLEVIYEGFNSHKPIVHTIPDWRVEQFILALKRARFDALDDHIEQIAHVPELWQLERAAGPYHKSLTLAPQNAQAPYSALVLACKTHLPEALRPIKMQPEHTRAKNEPE